MSLVVFTKIVFIFIMKDLYPTFNEYLNSCNLTFPEVWALFACGICGMPAVKDQIIGHFFGYFKTVCKLSSYERMLKIPRCSSDEMYQAFELLLEKKFLIVYNENTLNSMKIIYPPDLISYTISLMCDNRIGLSPAGFVVSRLLESYLWKKEKEFIDSICMPRYVIQFDELSCCEKCNRVYGPNPSVILSEMNSLGYKLISEISLCGPWSKNYWEIYPYGFTANIRLQ